jgi:hypothetical protein
MSNTDGKKSPGSDQGNAIENETRKAGSREGGSELGEDDESEVTEEDSKLAEEYPDGRAPGGKKY